MAELNGTPGASAALENRINQTLVSEMRLVGASIDALKTSFHEFREKQAERNAEFADRNQQHELGNKLQELTLRMGLNNATCEELKGKVDVFHEQLTSLRQEIATDEAREEFNKQEVKDTRTRKVERKETVLRGALTSFVVGILISLPLGIINLIILHAFLAK